MVFFYGAYILLSSILKTLTAFFVSFFYVGVFFIMGV